MFTHGVAHVVEICGANAYTTIAYFKDVFDVAIRALFSRYGHNPKRMFKVRKTAEAIGEDQDLLKLVGIHGIRWQAALLRAIKAVLADYVSLAIDLHSHGKLTECRKTFLDDKTGSLTLLSPLETFKGKTYHKGWIPEGGVRKKMMKARIVEVKSAPVTDGKKNVSDLLLPSLIGKYANNHKEALHKSIVLDLMESEQPELTNSPMYNDFVVITNARFLLTLGFLIDVRTVTSTLSLLSQRDCLLTNDVNVKHTAVQKELTKLVENPGPTEVQIRSEYDPTTEMYRGIAIPNWEEDEGLFAADRRCYIGKLKSELKVAVPLKDGVHGHISTVLDRTEWPLDQPENADSGDEAPLDTYGDASIEFISNFYKPFLKRKFASKLLPQVNKMHDPDPGLHHHPNPDPGPGHHCWSLLDVQIMYC